MTKLPISLKNKAEKYQSLPDDKKAELISSLYNKHNYSYSEIASLCSTYANKIIRDAKRLDCVTTRSRSETQKMVLDSGKCEHPTAGKQHSTATKNKIGTSVAETFEALSPQEKQKRSDAAKEKWEQMSPAAQSKFRAAAEAGIRRAAKEGSKLEKFLKERLTKLGYLVEFHRERIVTNQKLHLDIYIPELKVAIEVDGPFHFEPIWGQEILERHMRSDGEKNGLVLAQGWCLIRVRQSKRLSNKFKEEIWGELEALILQIQKKFPARGRRLFTIGG